MKKSITVLFAAFIMYTSVQSADSFAAEKPEISARACVLISADTGEVVYSENAAEKLPMASTTKIMTTLLCLESGNLYEEFTVDSEAIKVEGSSMGLVEGDTVTKYALCCGMLLPSGNDAANAVAVKLGGSIEHFAEMMNERAEELGLSHTYFVTPSGLEGDGHGSSAYDMAILAREALKNEIFREICSSETIETQFGNPPYRRWLKNTNRLLSMYDGVYGVKTGFTDEAGRCLVSACERDGVNLICVTLNDANDWQDHIAMYDYGFELLSCKTVELPKCFETNAVGGEKDKLVLVPETDSIAVTLLSHNSSDVHFEPVLPPFVYAPTECGETVAEVKVMFRNREICRIPLKSAESMPVKEISRKAKNTFIGKILKALKKNK